MRRRRRERRGWTPEAVLEALQRWQAEEGRPPRAYEWAPWAAAALGIRSARTKKWEREHDRWPSLDVTVARWGSWRQALQSAGLPTHPPLVLRSRNASPWRNACTASPGSTRPPS